MKLRGTLLLVMLLAACGEPERICLHQTCEERYYTWFLPVGDVLVPQRGVRTVCKCHEYYTPREPVNEER